MIYKFRAWDKGNNRWLPDDFVKQLFLAQDGKVYWFSHSGLDDVSKAFDIVFFTGLLDKNGAEIYQDDIVKDAKGNKAIIEWIDVDACFAVQTGNSEIFTISAHKQRYGKLEIIGNRHATPELLEADNA